jgi:hypothetical protein
MNWAVTVYAAILFFVLTPGILLSLPPKGSKMMVAATHAVVFALLFGFTAKMVWRASMSLGMPSREGLEPVEMPQHPAQKKH